MYCCIVTLHNIVSGHSVLLLLKIDWLIEVSHRVEFKKLTRETSVTKNTLVHVKFQASALFVFYVTVFLLQVY